MQKALLLASSVAALHCSASEWVSWKSAGQDDSQQAGEAVAGEAVSMTYI